MEKKTQNIQKIEKQHQYNSNVVFHSQVIDIQNSKNQLAGISYLKIDEQAFQCKKKTHDISEQDKKIEILKGLFTKFLLDESLNESMIEINDEIKLPLKPIYEAILFQLMQYGIEYNEEEKQNQ